MMEYQCVSISVLKKNIVVLASFSVYMLAYFKLQSFVLNNVAVGHRVTRNPVNATNAGLLY